MNYAAIRDQVYLKLAQITSIGTHIYKRPRYSADWKAFADLNTVVSAYDTSKFIYKWTWIDRIRSLESPEKPFGDSDEALTLVAVGIDETWTITYFHGFSDDDTHPSADDFHIACDAILEKFRWIDNIGFTNDDTVFLSDPAQMTFAGLVTLGGVLLHRGDFSLRLVQRDVTP